MKKNRKQGNLFSGYQAEKVLTVTEICKIFGGKVITQKQSDAEVQLLKLEARGRSGGWLVKKVQLEGVCWWVRPRNIRKA